MGMSASQARLVSLTARMSDTEYEAQQVNQQRLTLSNKMNEVYEAMCNMDVPTPPSKIDFAYDTYTGKIGASNVTVKPDANGTMKAYQEVEGPVTKTTKGTKGNATSPDTYLNKGTPYTKEDFEKYDINNYREKVTADDNVTTKWADFDDEDVEYVTGSYTEYLGIDDDGKVQVKTTTIDVPVTRKSLPEGDQFNLSNIKTHHCEGSRIVGAFASGKTYISTNGGEQISGDSAISHNTKADELSKKKFAVADGNSYKLVDAKDVKDGQECFEVTDVEKFKKAIELKTTKEGTVTSADGKKSGTTSSISALKDKEGFDQALVALQHSNPGVSDSELDEKFYAVDYGDGTYAFVQKSDYNDTDNSIYVYEVGKGTYDEEMSDYTITYDGKGNVNGMTTSSGASTALNTTQAYDEFAYDAAMASYTAEKAEYDREQNQLNKQTSIYQRQDKMLELKLTRLDNERNALNTEIEAVKKVIQDAVDRGFKTFSG